MSPAKKAAKSAKAAKKASKKVAKPTKKAASKKAAAKKTAPRSAKKDVKPVAASTPGLVAERLASYGGWQAQILSHMRGLIRAADPGVVEELKWRKPTNPGGVAVWSHDGILCTGESYKAHVRFTFMQGSLVADPKGLFNDGFGGFRRVIVLKEGERVDDEAFKQLIRAAVAVNQD